ncbi:MAG: thiamine biosynthesis protein ThiS [Desulfobulbus propionicus]|nr:MAG: thiamine biosynthesis protein ThiS [Desulfobulbus propionicus]
MELRVNGESHTTDSITLGELIQELGLSTEALVVEWNEQIIRQERWTEIKLSTQDRIELLNFVGGG